MDESTSVATLVVAWLVFCSAQAAMWAPLTTAAMGGLPTVLYLHGASAFAAAQQLAGAAFGAVLVSAYTVGSGARDAGVLRTPQAESAGQAAFRAACGVGAVVLVGALFLARRMSPAAADGAAADALVADATAAAALAVAAPVAGGTAAEGTATDGALCRMAAR